MPDLDHHDSEPCGPDEQASAETKPGFWQRRLIQPIRNQLTQGVTPRAIAVGIAVGAICGIFPVLGTTSVLTALVTFVFRLNQPITQAVSWLVYPLQIALIPAFVRGGEFLLGAEPISFSIPQMISDFGDSPGAFFSQFKMTFVHCIVAWGVAVPILAVLIIGITHPILRTAANRLTASQKPNSASS